MTIASKREALLLFFGDVVIFVATLWFTLLLRYGETPGQGVFLSHLFAFSGLFLVWVVVFFIAGLYEKHTSIFRRRLTSVVFSAQAINAVIAALFFYFIPYFGITPKTNLFLYVLLSFPLILAWRTVSTGILGAGKKANAILIGTGAEMKELRDEVNGNSRYRFRFVSSVDLKEAGALNVEEDIVKVVYSEGVSVVAVDLRNDGAEPFLPHLYNLIFSKVRFVDMNRLYEDIFDRIPVSLLKYNWFLENISRTPHATYDVIKRLMDISAAFLLAMLSLLVYPLVWLAIKIDDGGALFIVQERVGRNNVPILIRKFRTMTTDDHGEYGKGVQNQVTRVGAFLRKTRIDELPQLWSVLSGGLSLIGPRPELPSLVRLYEKEIPYYDIRHLITPGLSGWAQLYHENHPHHGADVDETKVKLSYDLYYIKNRSLALDITIALKTVKALVLRSGR